MGVGGGGGECGGGGGLGVGGVGVGLKCPLVLMILQDARSCSPQCVVLPSLLRGTLLSLKNARSFGNQSFLVICLLLQCSESQSLAGV